MWNEVKSIEDAYSRCPDIKKITLQDLNIATNKINGNNIDFTKTFGEQGFDQLNCIEIIMELEKNLNIVIIDEVADFIININSKPNFLLQEWRESKINKILND
jgi:acyl carrier protein